MKASDIMTRRVITVSPDATIMDAVRLMIKNRISGLPVVDGDGKLVGMVSEGDFLHRPETGTERKRSSWLAALFDPNSSAQSYVHSHGVKVQEVMTTNPVTVEEHAPLDEVVHLMEIHRVKRLPVLRRGKVVGIVSRANLMRALASVHHAVPEASKSDTAMHDRILAEIDKQDWAAGALIDVAVHGGAVDLWGSAVDTTQEEALKVLAESIPGVKQVHLHLIRTEELPPEHW